MTFLLFKSFMKLKTSFLPSTRICLIVLLSSLLTKKKAYRLISFSINKISSLLSNLKFSISLDFARGPGDWSNLDANYLRSRIAEQIGKDEDAIFLNRIQISTKYLDIYYDLRPSEYYFERRCTVETKYQIETVVADLFQGTSMEFCVPQRLTQVLETVMSPLEALPSTEKRRRNYVFNDGSEL